MKRILFFLLVVGMALSIHAQAPWGPQSKVVLILSIVRY